MATDLGADVSTFVVQADGSYDLDPTFAWIEGSRGLLERCVRRLLAERGSIPWARDVGLGVRRWSSRGFTLTWLKALEHAAQTELAKEDGVADARVAVTPNVLSTRELALSVEVVAQDGEPLKFVLAIDAVTAQLLQAST